MSIQPKDDILRSAGQSSRKTYFNKSLYPPTSNCQVLDAQISDLRDVKDLVYRKIMYGSRQEVKDFLQAKEIQFESQRCSQKLEDDSVYGSLDMQQDEYKKAEERIIGEANKKRQTMLITGGVVLLIGLAIFIK